ncbi:MULTISPECIES: hypothetical protein [unclassified Nocardiopsis]|uniref:hypothetical protein n=1 Tax=Nocardiopsis TaxID=2013 RepID=UPI00387B91C1
MTGTRGRTARSGGTTAAAGPPAAALTGCGAAAQDDDAPAPADGDGDGAYPITVTPSQGEVTIESAPERVVALVLSPADEPISLGMDPVKAAVTPGTDAFDPAGDESPPSPAPISPRRLRDEPAPVVGALA